ncbi:retrovirus-related pol polyprotein from transposon TNT 1-94 [Tanacetum coccineum]
MRSYSNIPRICCSHEYGRLPNRCQDGILERHSMRRAPRAWYDLLLKFLLSHEFSKGTVDPTLFIRRQGKDILLVQIYVDDIFASTTPELESSDPVDTPIVEKSKLDEDPQGKAIDLAHYRRMVGTFMYLTASRPDLTFVVCHVLPGFQDKALPEKQLHCYKEESFNIPRGTVHGGLMVSKITSIALKAFM